MKYLKCILILLCMVYLNISAYAKNYNAVDIYPVLDGWSYDQGVAARAVGVSVVAVLMPYFPNKKLNPILLKNDKLGPKVLYQRGQNNEYIIFVNIGGNYWAQLAYQFSHEFCHILSNYEKDNDKNQWFEESLCEAISIYTIDKMSIQWKHTPPHPSWESYASSLKEYVTDLLLQEHRGRSNDLSQWYTTNKESMRNNPYLRRKNEVLGTAIYRLIKSGNFNVSSIQYLNLGKENKHKDISKKLEEWYKHSPQELKQSVLNIAQMLGLKIQ